MLTIQPGNPKTFVEFISDLENQPAVPVRPGTVQIIDKDNTTVYTGELFRSAQAGFFEFTWTPPGRTPANPYQIVWKVPTAGGLVSTKTEFEIHTEKQDDFSFTTLVAAGFKAVPVELSGAGAWQVQIVDDRSVVYGETWQTVTDAGKVNVPFYKMVRPIFFGDYLVIANNPKTGDQLLSNLCVAPLRFYKFLPRLRTYIDRAKSPYYDIQAFQDYHIFTWFQEAFGIINALAPTSSWDWNTFPEAPRDAGLEHLLVMGAALGALRAQYLLYNTLDFDYTGPNVNVSVNYKDGLESEIGRLQTDLDAAAKEAKMDLSRQTQSVGTLAHRAYGSVSYGRRQYRFGR